MDDEPEARPDEARTLIACTQKIREEIRVIGAIAEVFQLFEGMAGSVKLEPDCLGVLGKLIVDRASEILEAIATISSLIEEP